MLARLQRWLARPVHAAGLAFFRAIFGLVMAWELSRSYSLGRIERYYVEPSLLFPYLGFGWLPRAGPATVHWLHAALLVAALLIALGLLYRVATVVFALGYTYLFGLDQSNYQNHLYLICLLAFILASVDAHAAFSLDALRTKARSPFVPMWQHALIAFQLAVVYAFGGINKLDATWLSGIPMAVQLQGVFTAAGTHELAFEPWVARSFAIAGAVIDLGAVPGLLWRRSRLPTLLCLTAFHLCNACIFSIGVFPWFMLGANTMFLRPDWPLRILRRRAELPASCIDAQSRSLSRMAVGLLATYAASQLCVPLRHYFAGSDDIWTASGAYFRWTMKLHTRVGNARLFVRLPDGTVREVNLLKFMSEKQLRHLAYTPDMIYRFTEFARRRYPRSSGYALRWRVSLALDGRAPQPYVTGDAEEVLASPPSLFARPRFVLPMQNGSLPTFSQLAAAARTAPSPDT